MGSCLSLGNRTEISNPIYPPRVGDGVVGSRDLTSDSQQDDDDGDVVRFTCKEMSLATDHFRQDLVIGEGVNGTVFRGVIDENVRAGYNSRTVAVEVCFPSSLKDNEWLRDVDYLGQLHHPNIVKVIGFCCEDKHRSLVYEYMQSGSLDKHIYSSVSNPLTWLQRMKIALGAAKGLAFIHNAERKIILPDFRTADILLDEVFNAKLFGFKLATEEPPRKLFVRTDGYVDPYYARTGLASAKRDVYVFGVILLEMLAGRGVLDWSMPEKERSLIKWGRPKLNENKKKLLKLLDPRMKSQCPLEDIKEVAKLTYQCLNDEPRERPHMSQVIRILEAVVQTADIRTIQAGAHC